MELTFISLPSAEASEEEALDAYSLAVTTVAERLSPSVANLRVSRRVRGGRILDGGGSGVVITPDGFTLTSAHVVARTEGKGRASFVDGQELEFEVVGSRADGRGRVVGINPAVAGVGLGLAVPINAATRRIVAALMSEGRFRRAYLGIAGGPRPLPPRLARELGRKSGVEIAQVVEGGPADQAGMRSEDLIVKLEGTPIESMDDLQRVVVSEVIGRAVRAKVVRGGRERELELVPAELEG